MAMTMAEAGRKGGLVRSQAKKDAARRSAAKRMAPTPAENAPATPVVFQCSENQPNKNVPVLLVPKS